MSPVSPIEMSLRQAVVETFRVQMSGQELTRLRIMIDLADGRITVEATAALMGLGRRQGFPAASCFRC